MLATKLGNVRVTQTGAGFEGTKGSWRTTEAWQGPNPGEAVSEGSASVTVESP